MLEHVWLFGENSTPLAARGPPPDDAVHSAFRGVHEGRLNQLTPSGAGLLSLSAMRQVAIAVALAAALIDSFADVSHTPTSKAVRVNLEA